METAQIDRLLRRMQQGDRTAFEALYDGLFKPVCSIAYSQVGDRYLAEDIAQETFVAIGQHIQQYRSSGHPMAWIFTIARNTAVTLLRKRSRETPAADCFERRESEAAPPSCDRRAEDRVWVEQLLSSLSETERLIVLMHILADMPFREIAAVLQQPLGSVLSRYYRSLQKCREGGKEDPRA